MRCPRCGFFSERNYHFLMASILNRWTHFPVVSSRGKGAASRSVLVVHDNPAIRQAISQAFLADGFVVCTTADGGADAIDLVERLKPDVIILDLSTPRMNGLQSAPRLRKIAPDTPIILFTLYGHEPPIEQAAAIEVNLVLSKTESIFSVVSKARELIEDHAFQFPRQPTRNSKHFESCDCTHVRLGDKCRGVASIQQRCAFHSELNSRPACSADHPIGARQRTEEATRAFGEDLGAVDTVFTVIAGRVGKSRCNYSSRSRDPFMRVPEAMPSVRCVGRK
jgi:CheY-like chemotaxis protein